MTKCQCQLLLSKIKHLRAALIESKFIKMNGVISITGYSFPFIFLFNNDDLISFIFCVTLYLQGMLFSIYSIIGASTYLNRGVSYLP